MIRKLTLLAMMAGCTASTSLPPPSPTLAPEPTTTIPEPPSFNVAWTARGGISFLQGRGEGTIVLKPFTRLEVLGRESGGWRVRCDVCLEPVEGLVADADIVHRAYSPEIAAWGSLPEFVLALRTAIEEERLDLLEPVMVSDFTQSLIGPQTPAMALEVWRSENLTTLGSLPALLDQGLSTRDTVIWSAPPAYTDSPYYRGPRTGFRRRPDGRWEWLYLIAGLRPGG